MPAHDSLKRLGGGRWETRDGRFAIEPQSGTWVVVDSSQTDDLGLPLIRGPFGTLTSARDAIETARSAGPAESPLADRINQARQQDATRPNKAGSRPPRVAAIAGEGDEPAPPPEPGWFRDLEPAVRRKALELIGRLELLGVSGPVEVARAEIIDNLPAVARLALERGLRKAIVSTDNPRDAVRAAVAAIMSGGDLELGARWHLVDDQGRRLDELDGLEL